MLKVLFVGDIVGKPGREAVKKILPGLIREESVDFTIANGENSAGGKGTNPHVVEELWGAGIDALTFGNHVWDRREVYQIIENERIIRPLNYPPAVPGHGFGIFPVKNVHIGIISLIGRVYMPHTDCPFRSSQRAIETIHRKTPVIIVDFHAEITSEKMAMGWYLNGKVSAVLGTHTHVPTADARILPDGTAYITDCGMVGPSEGIIGVDKENAIKRFLTAIPEHFTVAAGPVTFNAVLIEIEERSGKARNIKQIII